MRTQAGLLLAILLTSGAQACSIALTDLAEVDVDGNHVVLQRGTRVAVIDWGSGLERTVSEDFFPRSAAGPDGRVLVSAQRGLGADCTGDRYTALFGRGGDRLEEWPGAAAIASWAGGFFVAHGPIDAYSWQGDVRAWTGGGVDATSAFASSHGGSTLIAADDGEATVWRDGQAVTRMTREGAGLEAVAAGTGAAYLSTAWEDDTEVTRLQWWDGKGVWSFVLPATPRWPGPMVSLGEDFWFALDGDLVRFDTVDQTFTVRTFDALWVGGVGSDGQVLVVGLARDEHGGEGDGILRIRADAETYRVAPDGQAIWARADVPASQQSPLVLDAEAPRPQEEIPLPGILSLLGGLLAMAAGAARRAGKP